MNVIQTVFCTLEFPAIHNWPSCPFDEVAYLRDPHRHVFHVKAHKQVYHDDRDVEFIMLKTKIRNFLYTKYPCIDNTETLLLGATSCEMLASVLIQQFDLVQCEVNEDNENGSILYVLPTTGVNS